jgi:hypothetical protein
VVPSSPHTRALVEQLAGLLEHARPLELMAGHVCVHRSQVEALLARLRAERDPHAGLAGLDGPAHADLERAARAVDTAMRRGHQVPLTDQVRLTRRRADRLAAGLRSAIGG